MRVGTLSGKEPISEQVTYPMPVYRREKLGGIPRDYFDKSSAPGEG